MVAAAMEYRRGTYLLSSEYASAYGAILLPKRLGVSYVIPHIHI